MKNLIFTAFLILVSSTAFSQVAEKLLARDILTSQKIMKNEVRLYNYFYMEQVWPSLTTTEGRQEFVQSYLSQRAGAFWDMDFQDASPKNYAAGAGLYFAIDPHISKAYGNSFIELKVPAGTRSINVVAPIPLKKDTFAALLAEGYFVREDIAELFPKQNGFYRDTLRTMVLPKYAHFRKMVQHIFETNGIQFVEYNFNTSLNGFCLKNSYSAFLYVGTHNSEDDKKPFVTAEYSQVNMYSTELRIPNLSPEESASFEDIVKFRTLLDDIVNMRAAKIAIKRDFILSRYTAGEYQALKTRSFSCQ